MVTPLMNFSNLLKAEITRIARKVHRAELKTTRTHVLQQRHAIAALKREVAELRRELGLLKKGGRSQAVQPISPTSARSQRFSAEKFKAWREKAGVSAPAVGAAVGVSFWTIHNWEHGVNEPRASSLAKIHALQRMGLRELRRKLKKNA